MLRSIEVNDYMLLIILMNQRLLFIKQETKSLFSTFAQCQECHDNTTSAKNGLRLLLKNTTFTFFILCSNGPVKNLFFYMSMRCIFVNVHLYHYEIMS
jgi:hypothetical protein